MNLFTFIQLRQIWGSDKVPFIKPATIYLYRKWTHELEWYFDRL